MPDGLLLDCLSELSECISRLEQLVFELEAYPRACMGNNRSQIAHETARVTAVAGRMNSAMLFDFGALAELASGYHIQRHDMHRPE